MASQIQFVMPFAAPRLTGIAWEDEKTFCFQVECRGTSIARRRDSDFVNGTKLLNAAGLTRGRRDGILKHEQDRHVVKSGSMPLKGVWIPLHRASELARQHAIYDRLFPLFESDIEAYCDARWDPPAFSRARTFPPALTLPPISQNYECLAYSPLFATTPVSFPSQPPTTPTSCPADDGYQFLGYPPPLAYHG